MPVPTLMDVDTGIDDAFALLLAVRSPEVDVVGVGSVAGNVNAVLAARNTLRVLEVAGAGAVPVAVGAGSAIVEPSHDAYWVHGADGLGETAQPQPDGTPSDEHAVDQLLRLSLEHRGDLVVVAVGPLTNLALALRTDPGLAGRLGRVVVMGGSVRSGGNRSAWGEANLTSDPEAARVVFTSDLTRTMVGLDVTMQLMLDDADRERLATSGDPAGEFAAELLPFYLDAYARWLGQRRCAMHDPLAVAAVVDPQVLTTERLPTQIETHGGLTRGMSVVDLRARFPGWPGDDTPTTDVALDVDAPRVHALLLDRLTQQPRP